VVVPKDIVALWLLVPGRRDGSLPVRQRPDCQRSQSRMVEISYRAFGCKTLNASRDELERYSIILIFTGI
jgi:hypothetical protein